ncbi:MAG TPA: ROK family protein [Dehalococcoidia bacterium]|nr:ROK family protein [Dehalococcoidia bacterium]
MESYIIAIDMGGTRFRVAVASPSGKLAHRKGYPTRADQGRDAVISRIAHAAGEAISSVPREQILGVGFAAPGPLDPRTGVITTPPNLPGWKDVPLKAILGEALGLPVYIGNDANLAALGEHRFGSGRGLGHLVYLTVSTGIGAGIIVNGRLLLGEDGLAGEAGHMTIAEGPPCKCGNIGCLEILASGLAIARHAEERMAAGQQTSIPRFARGEITAEAVSAAAQAGDRVAREVLDRAANYLGIGVLNLVHIFNPQAVIIGGGVSQAGDLLFGPVRRIVEARAMPNFRKVRILPAALGDDVGLLGAVALVLAEASA